MWWYFASILLRSVMNQNNFRDWKVLCWNVRGFNSENRQRAVRQKNDESGCSVICLQETECEMMDQRFIRKFCPQRFDHFVFVPSLGASGGMIVLWNSALFSVKLIASISYGITMEFQSKHNSNIWTLVTVYGPCQNPAREEFINWLHNLSIPVDVSWLLLGDFNFLRSMENKNKPGGNVNDMLLFNEFIGHLGLIELPLKGRRFTWSNMQDVPLLEQIHWFFTRCELDL